MAFLLVLLTWESFAPFFNYFKCSARDRILHGLTNLALGGLNGALNGFVCVGLWWAITQWAEGRSVGVLRWFVLPAWAHWAGVFLMLDIWAYFWHRLNHRVPFFWRFHRVHHSDPKMDVTTANRFHVGEIAFSGLLRVPVIAVVGVQLWELAVYETVLFAVVQLHHANIRLPLRCERILQFIIVTPTLHKVHHSNWQPETDSNYSSLLSIWDRLFRTFRWHDNPQSLRFGLDELSEDEHQTLIGLLTTPARKIPRTTTKRAIGPGDE